eukprot:scaffold160864_cov47-Prasinocladus_malaysianus.AAC.1
MHSAKHSSVATCTLRPAAIYGPEEHRHLPRIAALMRLGLFRFVIGSRDTKVDWLHVENLVDAQLLAAKALLDEGQSSAANGQAFFISDNQPVNNFEFLRPLAEELNASSPSFRLSLPVALRFARACELMCTFLGIPPLITRAEVLKVGQTHHFSVSKAQK